VINKEMANVGITFSCLGERGVSPPDWKKFSGHLVYDIKIDFTWKARWVNRIQGTVAYMRPF